MTEEKQSKIHCLICATDITDGGVREGSEDVGRCPGCNNIASFQDKPFDEITMGHRDPQKLQLVMGPVHSHWENNHWARDEEGNHYEFDGHRRQLRVELETSNYLKDSYLSGREIRKGGKYKIFFDGVQVYEAFFRDPMEALIEVRHRIRQLEQALRHGSVVDDPFVGRKCWYRETPAIVKRWIRKQGCLWLVPAPGHKFPPPVNADEGEIENWQWDGADGDKVQVWSERITWHRDKLEPGEEV